MLSLKLNIAPFCGFLAEAFQSIFCMLRLAIFDAEGSSELKAIGGPCLTWSCVDGDVCVCVWRVVYVCCVCVLCMCARVGVCACVIL